MDVDDTSAVFTVDDTSAVFTVYHTPLATRCHQPSNTAVIKGHVCAKNFSAQTASTSAAITQSVY